MNPTKRAFAKLALDFSLLLILAALVAVVSVVGLRQVNSEYQQLIGHSVESSRLASKISNDFQQAVFLESNFLYFSEKEGLETAYETFVVPHQAYTESVEADVSQLNRLISPTDGIDDKEMASNLEKIAFDIETYKEDFSQIVALLEQREIQETGSEASLSQKTLKIDELLKQHPDQPTLLISHLHLRLAQQTYMTHRTSQNAEHVYFRYVELVEELERAPLSRREALQLEQLLSENYDSFQAIVQVDEELSALQHDVEMLVNDIRSLTAHIDAIALAEADLQLTHVRQITAQTTQLVTMSVIIIGIFAIGLGFGMYYQLNRGETDAKHTAVLHKGSELV